MSFDQNFRSHSWSVILFYKNVSVVSEYHAQLAQMSFDKGFDLITAGVYFYFFVPGNVVLASNRIIKSVVTGQAHICTWYLVVLYGLTIRTRTACLLLLSCGK